MEDKATLDLNSAVRRILLKSTVKESHGSSTPQKVATTTELNKKDEDSYLPQKQCSKRNKGINSTVEQTRHRSSCSWKQPSSSNKLVNPVSGCGKRNNVTSADEWHDVPCPLDFKGALLQSLPVKSDSNVVSNIRSESCEEYLASRKDFCDGYVPPVKRVDSVCFTPENQTVYSLTMKSDLCRTCGPLKFHEKISCHCNPRKPIVRPSRSEIWNHDLVQKNLKENGFGDSESEADSENEDTSCEAIRIMNLAATFVPNKNANIGNRAYKRPALIEHEKKVSEHNYNYKSKPQFKTAPECNYGYKSNRGFKTAPECNYGYKSNRGFKTAPECNYGYKSNRGFKTAPECNYGYKSNRGFKTALEGNYSYKSNSDFVMAHQGSYGYKDNCELKTANVTRNDDSYQGKTENIPDGNRTEVIKTDSKDVKKSWLEEFGFKEGPMRVPSWDEEFCNDEQLSKVWDGDASMFCWKK